MKDSVEIQEFYNDISEELAKDWYENDSMLSVLKQFVSLLPSSPRILDLGCGAGYESMRLRQLGADVTGIDYSEEPIRIARLKNPDCRFEIMDFREIDASLGCFDGIVALASLIHIAENELTLVFQNMKKVLKMSGYILIAIVEGRGLSEERSFIEHNGKQYKRYFYLHDLDSLSNAAHSTGLEFLQPVELPEGHSKYGWKGFIFQSGLP
jgi:2-polyprenyl-3-methyl-5-hydroxy-6-metoxy-1,4-benzoquinol methylase